MLRAPGWQRLPAPELALLLLAVAALYHPVVGYPFVSLDDIYCVVENPGLRDLSWSRLFFFYFEDRHDFRYFPTAYLSLAIDHRLSGMDPRAFHLTSVLLHGANTLLVFVFSRRLCRDRRIAFLCGLLFAVHPLQVEAVAWVANRKTVLFLFFFLLSALAYVHYAEARRARPGAGRASLAASVALFALAATSKPTAVTLPAALLLVDYQLAPRLPRDPLAFLRAHLPSKLLYLPVVVFVGVMAQIVSRPWPSRASNDFGALDWVVIAGHNLVFYVWKALAPVRLSVFYPLPVEPGASLPLHYYGFAVLAPAGVALCVWSWGRRRALFFGSAWYLVTIAPMALLPVFYSDIPLVAADRYFYQSSIGLFFLAATAVVALWDRAAERPRVRLAAAAAAAALLAAWSLQAWRQQAVWRGTLPLYEQVARHQPSDAFLYRLAIEYDRAGRVQEAFRALDAAETARFRIFFSGVLVDHLRIADLYRRKGDYARAARFLERGIESTPNAIEPADARTPLAWRYAAHLHERAGDGERAAALRARARTAQVDPRSYFESLWFTISPDAAGRFLQERVARAPEDAVAWFYLAQLHRLAGDVERAEDYERRARSLGFAG